MTGKYTTNFKNGVIPYNNLWLWGINSAGQLGNNVDTNKYSSPIQTVASGSSWKEAGISDHCGAILMDGTLEVWGFNGTGQLGDNTIASKSSPIQTVAGGTNWKTLAIGSDTSGGIKVDGTLWMWGINNNSQLGDNTQTSRSSPIQTVAGGTNWTQISCNHKHTGAIKTDGTLWTWGGNYNGTLGDNSVTDKASPVQTVTGGTNWSIITCGYAFTCGLKTDGTLWSWGLNDKGQLGDNSIVRKSSPVQTVAGGANWITVATGYKYTVAIKTDGTLWTWGYNNYGQLGDNTLTNRSSPVQTVAGGSTWVNVRCGYFHTGTVKTDGTLWMWGANTNGQLGDNTITSKSSPIQTVAGGTNWKNVYPGKHSTVATTRFADLGSVTVGFVEKSYLIDVYPQLRDTMKMPLLWSWGVNDYGQLGDNTIVNKSSPIQTIATGSNWKYISTNRTQSCMIKTDGTLWLMGRNNYGQLGDNTTNHRSSPIQTVAGGTNWLQVSSGGYHTAAIKTDNSLWTWGRNVSGQLGDNTSTHRSSPVQTVVGGTNWKQVATGDFHTTAIKSDGTLWTWGDSTYGQLGDNTITFRSSPIQTVAGGSNWSYVACGKGHIGAIKSDGTLWVWGSNRRGCLGDNTSTNRSSPIQTVAGGTNWKTISIGGGSVTGAIKIDGTLWMWGLNYNGQLGDNSISHRSSPIQTVAGGTNWKQLLSSGYHAMAIKTDGTLWGWGTNGRGQVGDNTVVFRSSPVQTITGGTSWKQVAGGYAFTLAIKEGNGW